MKREKRLYNKNEAKREILKMFLILLVFVPVLILLNFTLLKNLSSGWRITIDVLLCLGFVFVGKAIAVRISQSREEKKNNNKNNNIKQK